MNETGELLKCVYKNAKTAIEAIDMLISKTSSEEFLNLLENQREEYFLIIQKCNALMEGRRMLPPNVGMMSRVGTGMTIWLNSVNSRNTNRMAEVMISGSTEGMIELSRMLNSLHDADNFARALAHKLMIIEENNVRLMQDFV